MRRCKPAVLTALLAVGLTLITVAVIPVVVCVILRDELSGCMPLARIRGLLARVRLPRLDSREQRAGLFHNKWTVPALVRNWNRGGKAAWESYTGDLRGSAKAWPWRGIGCLGGPHGEYLPEVHRRSPEIAREMIAADPHCGLNMLFYSRLRQGPPYTSSAAIWADASRGGMPDDVWHMALQMHAANHGCIPMPDLLALVRRSGEPRGPLGRQAEHILRLLLPFRSRRISRPKLANMLIEAFGMTMHEVIPLADIPVHHASNRIP